MSLPESFPLKVANGKTIQIPAIGFGTWQSGDTAWAKDAILTALKAGYRHLDGAWMYGVDGLIGQAIRESDIPREEIFVTSKAWPHFFAPENVELCLDKVLQSSGLDYIDLFLAHWPCALKPISQEALQDCFSLPSATSTDRAIATTPDDKPIIDWAHTSKPLAAKVGQTGSFVPTWQAFQALVRKGKARAVGVSNFSIEGLEELLPYSTGADAVPISCHQIEVHPWFPQTELIEFGHRHGILTAAYSPFAGQKQDGLILLKEPTVVRLAGKNGMDAGQLLQSWAVQRGTTPLGKSGTPARIRSNLRIRKLSGEDFEALNQLALPGTEGRTVDFGKFWDIPIF